MGLKVKCSPLQPPSCPSVNYNSYLFRDRTWLELDHHLKLFIFSFRKKTRKKTRKKRKEAWSLYYPRLLLAGAKARQRSWAPFVMTYDNKSDAYRQRNCWMTYELYVLYEVYDNKKRKKGAGQVSSKTLQQQPVKRWNKISNETW